MPGLVLSAVQAILTSNHFVWGSVAALCLLLFRPQLRDLLARATSVGPAGIRAAAQQQGALGEGDAGVPVPAPVPAAGQPPAVPAVNPDQAADQLLVGLDDAYLLEQEAGVRRVILAAGLDPASPQAIRVLSRWTAFWYVIWEFERIYGIIFQSQIDLLRAMNVARLARDEVERAFRDVAARHPQIYEGATADQWSDFVTGQGLAAREGEGEDQRVHITEKGRSFLVFLVRQRKPNRNF